jgi:hypothetical protein
MMQSDAKEKKKQKADNQHGIIEKRKPCPFIQEYFYKRLYILMVHPVKKNVTIFFQILRFQVHSRNDYKMKLRNYLLNHGILEAVKPV